MQDNKVKLKEFYNQNIDYWEKYPREVVRKQYLEMLDLSDISKNSVLNILDIGCGSSRDAIRLSEILRDNRFSHFKGIGIDFSCKALEIAKKKDIENWTFFDGDFLDDDLKDINENDFDIVICSMVVMHYQDLNEVFNRLSSFLNEKGKLLLVTNKPYLVSYEY
jgi:2-polyprenyl-3-methyl-5-hydroxy-6-metoxy-1,4-benzoquinol methylase